MQVKQGNIVVRAPYKISEAEISALVAGKSAWLQSKLLMQQNLPAEVERFVHGATLWHFGVKKSLVIEYATKAKVIELESELHVYLPRKHKVDNTDSAKNACTINKNNNVDTVDKTKAVIKKHLEHWYKLQAQAYISRRLVELGADTGLDYNSYKIRRYKARWGSCNNRKELSFNYLLMMTPPWVIDYVIVHELCHLKHLNHSTSFWQLVEHFCPNYKQAKAWLKSHQSQLCW